MAKNDYCLHHTQVFILISNVFVWHIFVHQIPLTELGEFLTVNAAASSANINTLDRHSSILFRSKLQQLKAFERVFNGRHVWQLNQIYDAQAK